MSAVAYRKHSEASAAQIAAARPEASVWVSANAGSGKTRVLTARVARLLLAGAQPQRILCLTFTKAAAAEMQTRLFKMLGEWAMADDDVLSAELDKVLAEDEPPVHPDDLAEARRLFARALETPGGLKIQTIHAFCESLLSRFPLEAGVSPHSQIADDAGSTPMTCPTRCSDSQRSMRPPSESLKVSTSMRSRPEPLTRAATPRQTVPVRCRAAMTPASGAGGSAGSVWCMGLSFPDAGKPPGRKAFFLFRRRAPRSPPHAAFSPCPASEAAAT